MHRIRLAILLFLCVSAAGCQPVPGVLLDAEAIVMEHPDSAARLLEGVPAPEKRLSRRNYAHYALVLTQARWLAGENMIDDTLSDVALDYYRTHTDDFAAAHKAYYYAAKIAHQRRQPEVAMTLLLKSRDMLPPKGEWRRHYVVETWLGVFCGQQHLFEEKIRHAQQAYAYADSMERYDWMCISLGDMAHAYMGLDNYDSMEYYAIKALRLAEEKGITENTSPKWAMLIESALKRKEYRKAEEYWEKGFGHGPGMDPVFMAEHQGRHLQPHGPLRHGAGADRQFPPHVRRHDAPHLAGVMGAQHLERMGGERRRGQEVSKP